MLANGIMRKTDLVASARLAQSVERKALNLVVVGSSPTVGVYSWTGF